MGKLVKDMTEEERLAKNAKQRAYMVGVRARRAEDPEFDEACRTYSREKGREYRAKDPEADNAYKREWRAKNPEKPKKAKAKYRATEKGKAKDKAYADAHKPERLEASRRWSRRNPEKVAAATKKHQKENPDMWTAYRAARRARKAAALHPEHDVEYEKFLHGRAKTLTQLTGWRHCVDHVIPLIHGGWHHHDNLQVMPMDLNSSKNDNPFWENPEYCCWRDVPRKLWPEQLVPQYEELLKAA